MLYSVCLLFKSIHVCPSKDDLWEESIRLIIADNKEMALQKAQNIGKSDETAYKNVQGDMVKWKFVQIERIYEIIEGSISDGCEVFSRFLRESEVNSILTPFED